jgi:hypothetical protein
MKLPGRCVSCINRPCGTSELEMFLSLRCRWGENCVQFLRFYAIKESWLWSVTFETRFYVTCKWEKGNALWWILRKLGDFLMQLGRAHCSELPRFLTARNYLTSETSVTFLFGQYIYIMVNYIYIGVLRKENASCTSFCSRVQNFHRLIYKSIQLSISTGD